MMTALLPKRTSALGKRVHLFSFGEIIKCYCNEDDVIDQNFSQFFFFNLTHSTELC
jgi:hypothetical protein